MESIKEGRENNPACAVMFEPGLIGMKILVFKIRCGERGCQEKGPNLKDAVNRIPIQGSKKRF